MHETLHYVQGDSIKEDNLMKREDFKVTKWLPVFIGAIILMLIYKTIDNIGQITSAIGNFLIVISPLLYGILFTYFILKPHMAIERLFKKAKWKLIAKHARGITTILIFIFLLGLVILIFSFIVPIIISNVVSLANLIESSIPTIVQFLTNLPEGSIWANLNLADAIKNYSGTIIQAILNPEGIGQVTQGIMGFVGGIFSLIMGLVISLYILLDRDRIMLLAKRLNYAIFKREDRVQRTEKYFKQIHEVLLTFIASKGLDSLINFAVATIILSVFGVPYALLLGLVMGVFNFIPYLGSLISAFVISFITLITTNVSTAIYVLICMLIFHQLDGNFIEPRIMKSSLKINPILVIIAVVIGGAYMGIIGMFLAVPIAVIIKQLLLEYLSHKEAEKAAADANAAAAEIEAESGNDINPS